MPAHRGDVILASVYRHRRLPDHTRADKITVKINLPPTLPSSSSSSYLLAFPRIWWARFRDTDKHIPSPV